MLYEILQALLIFYVNFFITKVTLLNAFYKYCVAVCRIELLLIFIKPAVCFWLC